MADKKKEIPKLIVFAHLPQQVNIISDYINAGRFLEQDGIITLALDSSTTHYQLSLNRKLFDYLDRDRSIEAFKIKQPSKQVEEEEEDKAPTSMSI